MATTVDSEPKVPYMNCKSGRGIELVIAKDSIYEDSRGEEGLIGFVVNLLII